MNQVSTISRSQDNEFWLIQPVFAKKINFRRFDWVWSYTMYETLNRKSIFRLKQAMNQVSTISRSQDTEFWLIQPVVAENPILGVSVGFGHIQCMKHRIESALSG